LPDSRDSNPERPIPVLVLGSGLTALGVCRTLGRAGIPNYLINAKADFANRSRWVRALDLAARESSDARRLASLLGGLGFERAVLMPCSDQWSRAVAGLEPEVAERFPASVTTGPAADVFTDKDLFRMALERLGVPMPPTYPVRAPADLDVVPADAIHRFFLKPRDSQAFVQRFGKKAFALRNRQDAMARLDEMRAAGIDAVLQEYVVGPMDAHYFVDGFVDRSGDIKARFSRRRLLMYPIDFGNSTLVVSVPLREVAPAVESLELLLRDLKFRGIFSAEFKRDERDGRFKLLEVNARPWWFVEFAALSGVDVCSMAYRDALGLPVESIGDYEVGARHMLFPQHLRALLQLRRKGKLTLRSWSLQTRGARDAVFRWSDPVPGLVLAAGYLNKLWGRSQS